MEPPEPVTPTPQGAPEAGAPADTPAAPPEAAAAPDAAPVAQAPGIAPDAPAIAPASNPVTALAQAAQAPAAALPWDTAGLAVLSEDAQGALNAMDAEGRDTAALRQEVETFLAGGGERALAEEIIFQVAYLENISQTPGKNTCTAAAAQINLAEQKPAEYFRLASSLMSFGTAEVRGQTLAVSPENAAWIQGQQDAGTYDRCAAISASVQSALIDHANGGAKYDLARDLTVGENGAADQTGLNQDQFNTMNQLLLGARLVTAIMPKKTNGYAINDPDMMAGAAAQALRRMIIDAKDRGIPLLVGLREGGQTHLVRIRGIDASGQVMVDDPRGGRKQEMSLIELGESLCMPAKRNDRFGTGTGSAYTGASSNRRRP